MIPIEQHLADTAFDIYQRLQEIGIEATHSYCITILTATATFGNYRIEYCMTNKKNLTGTYSLKPYKYRSLLKPTDLDTVINKLHALIHKHRTT